MLKSFSVHNFIHFREPQRLDFKEGVNYIFGANSTGKSAVFELIRRCLSNDINTTTSSFTTNGGLPYVLCNFDVPSDDKNKFGDDISVSNIYAGLFIEKLEESDKFFYFYKVVILACETCTRVHVIRFIGTQSCNVEELENAEYLTCDNLQELKNTTNFDGIFKLIKDNVSKDDAAKAKTNGIYKYLSDCYVGVLGMRSIGPLQWTKSSKIDHRCREDNYKMASERAEIISTLIDDRKVDQNKLEEFEKKIVYPYKFKKKQRKDESTDQIIDSIEISNQEEQGNTNKPILKCPEGIVEAKQLVLLLSHNGYRTITLEEPDRGMHPQMVAKLRDWVFKKVEGQTVLVISHNPALVDHSLFDRTFVTTKQIIDNQISHTIKLFPKKDEDETYPYVLMNEMKQILFSERVLLVDGFTDKIFIEALFDFLSNDRAHLCRTRNKSQSFCEFVSTIYVSSLDGHCNASKQESLCDKLGKEYYRLADSDEAKKIPEDKKEFIYDSDEAKKINEDKKEFIFIWAEGALEEVINSVKDTLDANVKVRMDIPIKKKHYKKWKQTLIEKDYKDIRSVAKELVKTKEGRRFLDFLEKMQEKSEKTVKGLKRSKSHDMATVKRLKSTETEIDEKGKTGLTQDMMDVSI